MGHGLKLISFYVQKHIAALAMCDKPELVRDKPLGAPASVKLLQDIIGHQELEPNLKTSGWIQFR